MKKVFLTGGHSGVGLAFRNIASGRFDITAPTSTELDLTNFAAIDELDLSEYDIIVNCAARNRGTYLGFTENEWYNQAEQVAVNFTAAVLLLKQYMRQRPGGQFVAVTSTTIEYPSEYNIFMSASKTALRKVLEVIRRKNHPDFVISEVCPGKIKTGMLAQNYAGAKSESDIADEYESAAYLTAEQVAEAIVTVIDQKIDSLRISPPGPLPR